MTTSTSVYEDFHLKTDVLESEQVVATHLNGPNKNNGDDASSAPPRKGRMYSDRHSRMPGGIKVDEMIYGVKMAHLSCTDDSEERLVGSGANTVAALEEIVGRDNVHKPLSELLKEHFDLNMDYFINESGMIHMRPIDTQGFIASNDTTLVLSYRFSTTVFDWLTNLSMTSSEWEPDRDELIGHAGWCSCIDGWYTKWCTTRGKPRVHTGFYNNFVYTIPHIRKYLLEPLRRSKTPKKIYIVGCSLGAALATLAYCFVLEELMPTLQDPQALDHKLINVTCGSPRVCDHLMRERIMDKMQTLRPLDRAVICRLVFHQDLVPHVPFHIYGFEHLDKLVYITLDGDVIINPALQKSKNFAEVKGIFELFSSAGNKLPKRGAQLTGSVYDQRKHSGPSAIATTATTVIENDNDPNKRDDDEKKEEVKTAFELEVETTPEPIKDHMPYWYLTKLQRLQKKVEVEHAGGV